MSVLRLSALHGAIVPLFMLGAGPALAQTTPSSPALFRLMRHLRTKRHRIEA